jgi:hypothetical protein
MCVCVCMCVYVYGVCEWVYVCMCVWWVCEQWCCYQNAPWGEDSSMQESTLSRLNSLGRLCDKRAVAQEENSALRGREPRVCCVWGQEANDIWTWSRLPFSWSAWLLALTPCIHWQLSDFWNVVGCWGCGEGTLKPSLLHGFSWPTSSSQSNVCLSKWADWAQCSRHRAGWELHLQCGLCESWSFKPERLVYQGRDGFDGYEDAWASWAVWMTLNGLSRSILPGVMNLSLINISYTKIMWGQHRELLLPCLLIWILNLLMHAHNNKIISHVGRNHFSIITKVYLRVFELCFTPCLWGNVLKVVLMGDVGHPEFSHL